MAWVEQLTLTQVLTLAKDTQINNRTLERTICQSTGEISGVTYMDSGKSMVMANRYSKSQNYKIELQKHTGISKLVFWQIQSPGSIFRLNVTVRILILGVFVEGFHIRMGWSRVQVIVAFFYVFTVITWWNKNVNFKIQNQSITISQWSLYCMKSKHISLRLPIDVNRG